MWLAILEKEVNARRDASKQEASRKLFFARASDRKKKEEKYESMIQDLQVRLQKFSESSLPSGEKLPGTTRNMSPSRQMKDLETPHRLVVFKPPYDGI